MRMNNTKTVLLVVIVALIVSLIGAKIFSGSTSSNQDVLTKVLDKGEIKIGYVINPPSLIKNPNTGQLSGIYYDAVEQLGKNLGLKINWAEETGWGTMVEGLGVGRYDMVVGGIWPSATRARRANFSVPLYFSTVGVYTKPGDNRFSDLNRINNKNIIIAVVDGEMSSIIASTSFPNAKLLSLPQDTQLSQLLLSIKTGKADLTFVEKIIAEEFLANNPNSVQNIVPNNPIRSFGNTIVVPKNQSGFEGMINTAIGELVNSGVADELVKKYEKYPDSFYPVSKPYNPSR
ncbi:MAG: transporter substrate-binding domain-containing protein [Patescibacteria group bacterium]